MSRSHPRPHGERHMTDKAFYLALQYERLKENGWVITSDGKYFKITYPAKIRERYGLVDTAGLNVSHQSFDAAIAAAEAALDVLHLIQLTGKGGEALTDEPQDAGPITPEARENIVDTVEGIILDTHDIDVRDRHYAENVVGWLERHHPAALRAIAEGGA